jgi:acyl-CoA thioesterase
MTTGGRFHARVNADGALIGASTNAIRAGAPEERPTLWFPASDIDDERLQALNPTLWQRGEDEWDGFVSFDHDKLEVQLLDGPQDDPERSIKRFPTWGDASELIAIMDVQRLDAGRYLGPRRPNMNRPVVEGSQLLGQSIIAATREVAGTRAVSASMMFLKAVTAMETYEFVLEPMSRGRTFNAFAVQVRQGEKICAAGTVLLDATAPAVVEHADPAPDVARPYDCPEHDMGVTGRELRVVDDAYTNDSAAPVGPPDIDAWVRFRDVPADPPIHAGLLAQFTGHMSIAAALRPHAGIGQEAAHVTISTAINAISISLHADVRADEWMLYHHHSSFSGDGMTHSNCAVYNEDGRLLASFTVEAMVRPFADPSRGDARTAL